MPDRPAHPVDVRYQEAFARRIRLYRVARPPDPLEFPPREFIGRGRYDDPLGEYRVLYAARRLETCFVEILAAFRPQMSLLAQLGPFVAEQLVPPLATVSANWPVGRLLGGLSLHEGQRFLDLRAAETRRIVRAAFAAELVASGIEDYDLGDTLSRRRAITQAISR